MIKQKEVEGLQALVISLSERIARLEAREEINKENIDECREKIRKLEEEHGR